MSSACHPTYINNQNNNRAVEERHDAAAPTLVFTKLPEKIDTPAGALCAQNLDPCLHCTLTDENRALNLRSNSAVLWVKKTTTKKTPPCTFLF